MIPQSIRRTDSRLVRQVLRGRRDSFNRLVERHLSGVYAVALARTQNHADAEDVVQDTFIRAYTVLDQLREPGSFGGWVTTIARNAAVKLRAKRIRDARVVNAQPGIEPSSTPDPARAELQSILRTKLDELDDDAREVLLMHYFAGESTRAIAERLEISRDATLKRLERARGKLAKAVLHDLEASVREREPDLQKQRRKIAGAIALMALPWTVRKAAASVSARVVVGCGIVVFGVALIAVVKWPGASSSPELAGEPEFTLEAAVITPTVPEEPPVAPGEPFVIAEAVDLETAEPAPVEPQPSLDGLWSLHQPKDAKWPEGHDWPASATVEMTQDGNQVTVVRVMPVADRESGAEGTLEDGQLTFPLLDIFGIMFGGDRSAQQIAANPMITGPADPTDTRIRIKGTLPPFGLVPDSPPMAVDIVMNKLDKDEADVERDLKRHVAIAHQVRDAILAYAYDHRGRLPETLADLVPRYIDDGSIFENRGDRSLIYNPDAVDLMSVVESTSDWSGFRPDLSLKERVMAWELERTLAYGERFPDPAKLLQVRVGSTNVSIRVGFRGEPEIDDPDRLTLGQPGAAGNQAWHERSKADACMHQIKGAGLGIVQFWDLTEEQFNPAGWRSLVPEFINDPSLLTCPSHDPGTLSYAMAFPAMSRAQLTAIYADATGLDGDAVEWQDVANAIPMVLEAIPHVIDGRDFRAALFLDGHVGMFHDRDWAKYVEPYLAYSDVR